MAASVAGHAAVLALIAVHAPRLRVPQPQSGPPEAIIPVLIMPRTPPPTAAAGSRPAPIRLHRRPQRFALEPPSVSPLLTPQAEQSPRPAPSEGPRVLNLPSAQDVLAANARKALRGRLGCANAQALGLSRAEREACENQLAAGARDAEFPGIGIDADKATILARAAARKQADYDYKRGGVPPGTPGGNDPSQRWRVNVPPTASDRGRRGPDY